MLVHALTFVAIIALGYGAKRVGWVALADFGMLSRVVLRITLPCALATSFNTFDITPGLLGIAAVGAGAVLLQQVFGHLIERRNGRRAQAFAVLNIGSYNIGLFAIPYVSTFVGQQAIIYAALFDVGNSLMVAGLGYAWGHSLADAEAKRMSPVGFAKKLLSSPVFDTYLALTAMRLAHLKLPDPVIVFTSTVGVSNAFLAMFMIGVGLEIALSRAKFAAALRYLAIRYGFALAFTAALWFLMPLEGTIKIVLCMIFFAPMAAMTSGFTDEADLDTEVSSFMTSVSVVIALVAMPVVLALLQR